MFNSDYCKLGVTQVFLMQCWKQLSHFFRNKPSAWCVQYEMTNLNTELLCFDIMHKEGKALLPHRVFGCIRNLWQEKTVTG